MNDPKIDETLCELLSHIAQNVESIKLEKQIKY